MNREIEFKVKNIIYEDWEYVKLDSNFEVNEADTKTVCQLITTINDIKLYEYDCFFDIDYPEYIVLFCYNSNGILLKKDIHLTRFVEVGIGIIKYADNNDLNKTTKLKYVGNWHDGTETILNNIKELQK